MFLFTSDNVTHPVRALPDATGLPHDGPHQRQRQGRKPPSPASLWPPAPANVPPFRHNSAVPFAPCPSTADFPPRTSIRPGRTTRQPPAHLPATPSRQVPSPATARPGRLQLSLVGRPPSASPRTSVLRTRAPRQAQPISSAQQGPRIVARTKKSAGRGSAAPLAATPAQDTRTHEHPGVAREKVKLAASLVSRPYVHVPGPDLVNTPPLIRPVRTYNNVQTSQRPAVLPVEQGNDHQAAVVHYAGSCQGEHVPASPGVTSVATSSAAPPP